MHNEEVSCKEVMSHICDNLGEDLNSPRCVAIKQHLETCGNCKCYFKSVEDTIKFYKQYNVEMTNDSHNKLMDILGLNDKNKE